MSMKREDSRSDPHSTLKRLEYAGEGPDFTPWICAGNLWRPHEGLAIC